ncbi:MAG: PAS domain S-box protein [Desulfoferrobacter sp.]
MGNANDNGLQQQLNRLEAEESRSKLVEEALKEALTDYELLIENIPGVVYKGYVNWDVDFYDDKIEALTGYPRIVFNSRRMKWSELMLEEDIETVKDEIRKVLKGNKSYLREFRIRARNGQTKWIQDRGTIVFDQQGQIHHFSGIFFDITERKLARDELIRTRMEMDQIFRTAADGMRIIDRHFNALKANDTFMGLAGISEEALWNKCYEVLSGPLCHTPECPLKRILQGEPRIEIEVEKQRTDGTVIDCILTATPFRDETGEILGIVEDFKDISDRKRTEKALKRSEENYRQLIGAIPSIVFKGYKDWSVDFVDDKVEELTGYPKSDFDSRKLRWSDLVLEEDIGTVKKHFKRALEQDRVYVREYRIKTRWDQILWIQERSRILAGEKGEWVYVSGVFFDITEKKRMSEELERSNNELAKALSELEEANALLSKTNEELQQRCTEINDLNAHLEMRVKEGIKELVESIRRYKRLFENSKDMIYICDEKGRIIDVNPSGMELLGYDSLEDFLPATLEDVFRNPEEAHKYRQILQDQGFITDYAAEFRRNDGSILDMLVTASAIYEEKHKFAGCEGIAKDITQLQKITESLIETQKMATIGQLAAGVAHEINTPLMIILANAQVSMDDFPEGSEMNDSLKTIEKQTKICARIVADLLEFSRQTERVMESVDINQTIDEVLAVLEHSLKIDRIHVKRHFDPNLAQVFGDSEKLKQVYVNILNNAHQAIEADGAIAIVTQHDKDADEVVVSFLDSGPGISPEIKQKVFDPFFSTKGVGKGIGLGLSVSFGIIKDHQGHTEIESPLAEERWKLLDGNSLKRRGPGTAFIIHLPLGFRQT